MSDCLFCRIIAALARDRVSLNWRPDLVHCNDWQTGLTPLLLAQEVNAPATLFTIHNLSYQGVADDLTQEQEDLYPRPLLDYDREAREKGWMPRLPRHAQPRRPELGVGRERL